LKLDRWERGVRYHKLTIGYISLGMLKYKL